MSLYETFHRDYYWTMAEIDDSDMGYLLTLARVRMLQSPAEKLTPIDEVL